MQTDASNRQAEQSKRGNEELTRKLRTLLSRTSALSVLVREETNGDRELASPSGSQLNTLDLSALRQGLREVEQMTATLLYEVLADGELQLTRLPDLPLTEAFSQLVETTAETLKLSSRVAFSGSERSLSAYLARLLYHITQEALAQVSAHAGAHRLRFSLDYGQHEIALNIEDDGIPGSQEEPPTEVPGENETFPLFLVAGNLQGSELQANQSMGRLRTIVEDLGGTLLTNSEVEQGTQIQVRIPYQATGYPTESSTFTAPQESVHKPAKIKLLIVDAQAVSRAGLHKLLESYRDLEVVGEASDSVQAVSETAELLPQVVLIDAQLPGEQSLELLRQLHELNPDIHAVLLSAQENEELLYETLRAGASGYILKDSAPDQLIRDIRAVARGDVLVQPQVAARLLASFGNRETNRVAGTSMESLTAREREVLQLLARGLRNKEIAARLFVSERTVNFHLANIYSKLHVSGRTEALSKALEQGLLKV